MLFVFEKLGDELLKACKNGDVNKMIKLIGKGAEVCYANEKTKKTRNA